MLWDDFQSLGTSYYNIEINPDALFGSGINEIKCQHFIEDHFKTGRKNLAFDIPFIDQYYKTGKHIHTVFLYLMGLSVRSIFIDRIKNSLSMYIDDLNEWYSDKEYMYSWFLTCLYHDTASCIEKISSAEKIYSANDLIYHYPRLVKKDTDFPFYTKNTVFNYYDYKKIFLNEQDHGIIGGILFYKNLMKNYNRIAKPHITPTQSFYEYPKGMIWRSSHPTHFAYVANAIICHNLWTADITDTDKVFNYRKFSLDELIIDSSVHEKDKRISIQRSPLCFLLCLLDTIEPTKRFNLSPKEIANSIILKTSGNDNLIIQWTDLIKKQPEFYKWLGSLIDLYKWMKVDIPSCECSNDHGLCQLRIHFLE